MELGLDKFIPIFELELKINWRLSLLLMINSLLFFWKLKKWLEFFKDNKLVFKEISLLDEICKTGELLLIISRGFLLEFWLLIIKSFMIYAELFELIMGEFDKYSKLMILEW